MRQHPRANPRLQREYDHPPVANLASMLVQYGPPALVIADQRYRQGTEYVYPQRGITWSLARPRSTTSPQAWHAVHLPIYRPPIHYGDRHQTRSALLRIRLRGLHLHQARDPEAGVGRGRLAAHQRAAERRGTGLVRSWFTKTHSGLPLTTSRRLSR